MKYAIMVKYTLDVTRDLSKDLSENWKKLGNDGEIEIVTEGRFGTLTSNMPIVDGPKKLAEAKLIESFQSASNETSLKVLDVTLVEDKDESKEV